MNIITTPVRNTYTGNQQTSNLLVAYQLVSTPNDQTAISHLQNEIEFLKKKTR